MPNGLPSAIEYLSSLPQPIFNPADVEWAAMRSAHRAAIATRSRLLDTLVADQPSATLMLDGLAASAAPTDRNAFRPHNWVDLLEPQVTRGLAWHLQSGDIAVRALRTLCLLRAAHRSLSTVSGANPFPISLDSVRGAQVIAEAPCDGARRIDIIAWVETRGRTRWGLAIEAKLGHQLTQGQLDAYAAAARERYDIDHVQLLVIAPRLTPPTFRQIRDHVGWVFVSWRTLMARLTTELGQAQCDDADFARFRSTILSQTS